jgi:hypothetical protein
MTYPDVLQLKLNILLRLDNVWDNNRRISPLCAPSQTAAESQWQLVLTKRARQSAAYARTRARSTSQPCRMRL